jgi:hypothetical protein
VHRADIQGLVIG